MFNQIRTLELPAWVETMRQEGKETSEEILPELQLIDDLLTLQRSKNLLNRKNGLKKLLVKRIEMEVGSGV